MDIILTNLMGLLFYKNWFSYSLQIYQILDGGGDVEKDQIFVSMLPKTHPAFNP